MIILRVKVKVLTEIARLFFASKHMKHNTLKKCLENTFNEHNKRFTVWYRISRSFLEGLYMTCIPVGKFLLTKCAHFSLRGYKTGIFLRNFLPSMKTTPSLKVCNIFFDGLKNRQISKEFFTIEENITHCQGVQSFL